MNFTPLPFQSYKVKDATPQTLARIFSCLASWWDHTNFMNQGDIRVSPLLEGAFYILHHPDDYPEATYDAAKEWVLSLLYSNSVSYLLNVCTHRYPVAFLCSARDYYVDFISVCVV